MCFLGEVIRELDIRPALLPEPRELRGPVSSDLAWPGLSPPPTGWRLWLLESDLSGAPLLTSPAMRDLWFSPAAWNAMPPSAGSLDGFYLLWSLQVLAEVAPTTGLPSGRIAVGECEPFGRVVEHDFGSRSQGVVLRRLWIDSGFCSDTERPAVVASLRGRYQCEVGVSENWSVLVDALVPDHAHPDTNNCNWWHVSIAGGEGPRPHGPARRARRADAPNFEEAQAIALALLMGYPATPAPHQYGPCAAAA